MESGDELNSALVGYRGRNHRGEAQCCHATHLIDRHLECRWNRRDNGFAVTLSFSVFTLSMVYALLRGSIAWTPERCWTLAVIFPAHEGQSISGTTNDEVSGPPVDDGVSRFEPVLIRSS